MKTRFLIYALIALAGCGLAWWINRPVGRGVTTPAEMAAYAASLGRTNAPLQAVLAPLDLKHPVRLAVGGLGLADTEENRQLGDLITVSLSDTPGFELVERKSLEPVLQELNLSLNGFVRAADAVRVGKLLKVDWFLLGTEAVIDGRNCSVIRLVDARTGVMRDAGVFPADKPLGRRAAEVAAFARQTRENAVTAKTRVYLAVGTLEDVGVNNRRADFPGQLRGYLTAAYEREGGRVTMLERDYVDVLLQEVHLDMAGLVEDKSGQPPAPMQSAFWLVTGQYQSYETTNYQVEVKLEVQRIFGSSKPLVFRGLPDESICQRIKAGIDGVLNQSPGVLVPTRLSEAHTLLMAGRDLAGIDPTAHFNIVFGARSSGQRPPEDSWHRRNCEEAIKAFKTVLLLDPGNQQAKLYLAEVCRDDSIRHDDEAREWYRQILEKGAQDRWGQLAQWRLRDLMDGWNMTYEERIRWLDMALAKSTDSGAADYFRQLRADKGYPGGPGVDDAQAEGRAEQELWAVMKYDAGVIESGNKDFAPDFGTGNFVGAYGGNYSGGEARLVALYPKMKTKYPREASQILEAVVSQQSVTNGPLMAELETNLDWQIAHPQEASKSRGTFSDSLRHWALKKQVYPLVLKVIQRDRLIGRGDGYFSEETKIIEAFADMKVKRWQEAVAIFEGFSNRPVLMGEEGPWGDLNMAVDTDWWEAFARKKAGLPETNNPAEFQIVKAVLPFGAPAVFSVDDNGLWVGVGGRLLQLGFDMKTNQDESLPMNPYSGIAAIVPSVSKIWIGTGADGLIEYDRRSHQCRRFTEADGLLMNSISSLSLTGDTLWIGYGKPLAGGLGRLDLATGKIVSFTPSLLGGPTDEKDRFGRMVEATNQPTHKSVSPLLAGPDGNVWFATDDFEFHHYRSRENIWERVGKITYCSSLVADADQLYCGLRFGDPEQPDSKGNLGISILNLKAGGWRELKRMERFPTHQVTALALDGKSLWVGGMGYVAELDPVQEKVLHYAYIRAPRVDGLQVGGGYLWVQLGWCLYRVPLSELQ